MTDNAFKTKTMTKVVHKDVSQELENLNVKKHTTSP